MEKSFVKIRRRAAATIFVTVGQKVLHQRRREPVFWMVSLQTLNEGDGERAIEISVFSITLFRSAPTRIAAQVSIGRADYDATLLILLALKNVAGFEPFNRSRLAYNF